MERGEAGPTRENNNHELTDIRKFLQIEIRNYRFGSQGIHAKYHEEQAKRLEDAIVDLGAGNYRPAINILESYYTLRRRRADSHTDPEGLSSADNRSANKIAAWIEVLKSQQEIP